MATQTIEFAAPSGQTISTVRLFAAGSDTIVDTAAATERTNAKGVYTAAFTDLAAGLYRLVAINSGGSLLAQWWTRTAAQTGTYYAYENPDAGEWTATRAGYLDGVLIAANFNQRTVSVTGSNHVAADIHELQAGVIQSTHFSTGAVDANALASDAVVEIRTGLGLASANLDTQLSGIQSDTNDIQSRLPAALISGRMDSNVQAIAAGVVTQIQAGLSTLTAAQVNAEVLDVLATDLFGELAAVPGASSSLKDKIAFLFMLARNKVTQTSNTQTLFADNTTTPVAAATTSDVGGTFTRGEFA